MTDSVRQFVLNKIPGHDYWDHFFMESDQDIIALLSDDLLSEDKVKFIFKKFVCIINIETSTYCNRKCTYCPNSIYDRTTQHHIPDEAWGRVVSDLVEIDYGSTVSLNLYNEPLADGSLMDRIRVLRDRLPRSFIKFNSNGDYLDNEVLDELSDSGNSAIFVTLHPDPGKLYMDSDRKNHFELFLQRLGRTDANIDNIPGIKMRSEFDYKGMRVLVMTDNWFQFGNDRSGILSKMSISNRTNPCMRPFREFTLAHDAYAYPCCQFFSDSEFNKNNRIGRIQEKGIFEIYMSSLLKSYRRDLLGFGVKKSPCNTCRDDDNSCLESTDIRNYYLEKAVNKSAGLNND